GDVKTTEDIKVLLRWGWGAETTNKMSFKPSEELKVGDGIKVTIEKVVVVPDPVEEKVEETPVEAEEGQEPVDDKVEAIEKTELEAEGDTAEEGEKVVVETEKTDEASDETKTA
ncbi:MAG TPA: hypothetical protein DCR59_05190, partial [Dehalococcoidia bacterium]|nr:hypothetical protein [Dehalococcoidia bacterium]